MKEKIKKLKIWYYKWRARAAHKRYSSARSVFDSGNSIAEYISIRVSVNRRKMENYVSKAKELEGVI